MGGLPENAVLDPLHWVQFGTHANAKAEAFFSTLKTECFPANQFFATKGEARRELFEYIEVYYNNQRLHSALGYQTPSQYETEFSRVIDIAISSAQSIDVAPEDRALQGCNSSARATLHTARTVLHTLRVLEGRGIVEAKPRSGFYIMFRNQLPEPLPQPLRLEASPVEVSKLRYQAFSIGNSKGAIPLSIAVPSSEIIPTVKLGRMISVRARSASAEVVDYAEPPGYHKLRKQLARRSSDWGCLMKPEDFLVNNGASEAIALALRTVCSPASAVLVESPTYYGTLEMIEIDRTRNFRAS